MVANIQELRMSKIPDLSPFLEVKSRYPQYPISRVTSDEEELINLEKYGKKKKNHYYHSFNPPYFESIPDSNPFLLCRKKVAEL